MTKMLLSICILFILSLSFSYSANALGIEFVGFHYTAAILPCEFDEKLGKFQFRNLVEHERWLSDAEAKKILEQ